eukprot:gene17668-5540_t
MSHPNMTDCSSSGSISSGENVSSRRPEINMVMNKAELEDFEKIFNNENLKFTRESLQTQDDNNSYSPHTPRGRSLEIEKGVRRTIHSQPFLLSDDNCSVVSIVSYIHEREMALAEGISDYGDESTKAGSVVSGG